MSQDAHNRHCDDLDCQIRAALQVETSSPQLERLEQFWRRQSRAQCRRRRAAVAAGLAAAALLVVTASLNFRRPEAPSEPMATNDRPRIPPGVRETDSAQISEHPEAAPSTEERRPATIGRAPTPYERFAFITRTSGRVENRPASVHRAVETLIAQLLQVPEVDVEQLVSASGEPQTELEGRLLQRLPRSNPSEKHGILRLLASCGSSRSTPQLLQLSRDGEYRHEALATIEQIVGFEGLHDAARRSTDRGMRSAIFRRLLTAGDENSLRIYLSLIHDPAFRAEALAAADAVSEPLLTRLLDQFDDEDESVRLASALVLGHANGPIVTRALIARVTQGTKDRATPREAWIALWACRGEQAERFFAYAAHQPRLLGQVYWAQVWWARMTL